ncbi:putative nuclease HARBI1 isoform X2 [Zophobas morio]|uniref:putative nuclease HARBI1 isoform X2 n=1 Tax=Zophobas morio TaxID=2755281 RepID=UPI003082E3A0
MFQKLLMLIPDTEDEWKQVSRHFAEKWNFPNCLGAIDGKHINIKAPPNSGSLYFNYKQAHSIILMGLADANYKFLYINIGAPGRDSDGGVYMNCSLSQALENNTLNIPESTPLPGRKQPIPYVVVADDAFALKPYMLKPFAFKSQSVPERIFNYRLSRARRIIENVFGIASARFRVLRRTMELSPPKVKIIVSAVCVLHNFLMSRKRSSAVYAPLGTFDTDNEDGTITLGTWRNTEAVVLEPLQRTTVPRNATMAAKMIRDEFKEYFCREGEVPWQRYYI